MRLGLGCVSLGTGAGRRAADDIELVRGAIDMGVTVFDTADAYGAGASERVLGRAVGGRRDEVVIATKGGFAFRPRRPAEQLARRWLKPVVARLRHEPSSDPTVPPDRRTYAAQDFSPRHLRLAVHASLRRLRTDRIDVYQLHSPAEVLPHLFEELADLVYMGDVAQFGVGAPTPEAAEAWLDVPGVSVVQVPFGLLDPLAATTTLPRARELEREVWARGVFGGGVLSLAERDSTRLVGYPKLPLVRRMQRIASDAGLDQYELALGFVQAHPRVSTILIGSTSEAHLRRNVDLLAGPPLREEVLEAVREAFAVSKQDAEDR